MPTIFIWYPDRDHPYGHAALQTAKYHISFWPDGDVKEELDAIRTAINGVPASLHFHHELDRHYEGNRLPTGSYEIDNATDNTINDIYEEFLEYNGIDPANVTMEAAKKLIDKKKKPEATVSKTPYSFSPLLKSERRFYHAKQNCVSLCFNLIQAANPTMKSINFLLYVYGILTVQNVIQIATVPWFESYIKKHWVKDNWWDFLNVFDNSVTRTVWYWTRDRWNNNNIQIAEQVGVFLDAPVDFKSGGPKSKQKGDSSPQ